MYNLYTAIYTSYINLYTYIPILYYRLLEINLLGGMPQVADAILGNVYIYLYTIYTTVYTLQYYVYTQ